MKTVSNFILLLISIAIALFFSELLVRTVLPQPVFYIDCINEYQPNNILGWIGRPDAQTCALNPDTGELKKITRNNLGLRMIDNVSIEKSRSKKRILLIGDSFTKGEHLGDNETISYFLQQLFPDNYEVINLGVSAYSTIQSLIHLRDFGLRLDPDIVILLFYPNDLFENLEITDDRPRVDKYTFNSDEELIFINFTHTQKILNTSSHVFNINKQLKRKFHLFFLSSKYFDQLKAVFFYDKSGVDATLYDNSSFYKKIKFHMKNAFIKPIPLNLELGAIFPNSRLFKPGVEKTLLQFEFFDKLRKENKFKAVVVNIPSIFQLNEEELKRALDFYFLFDKAEVNKLSGKFQRDIINQNFTKYFKNKEIKYFDLFYTPEFQTNSSELYFRSDFHWNAKGTKTAANLVYEHLMREGLID